MNDMQIEYFLAVAEKQSFSRAAAEMFVSQPAISRQIAMMEKELGVALFERRHKTTELTDAGQMFADFYRKQRGDLNEIISQVKGIETKEKLALNIACNSSWTLVDFLPGILKVLSEEYPSAKISLENYGFDYLETALYTAEADVAIVISTCIRSSDAIEVRLLTEIQRRLIYSKKHPAAAKKNITPQDFKDEIFFVPPPYDEKFIVNLVKSFVEPYGITPHLRFTESIESMFTSVANGLGVAVADAWATDTLEHSCNYISLNSKHKVVVAWHRKSDNPMIKLFLEELLNCFPESEI